MTTTQAKDESWYLLGETLKPKLTNDMGSAIEIFDTTGTPDGGPPTHTHPWEEIYVVIKGHMDVMVGGELHRLGPGGIAHVPAKTPHSYRTLDKTEFLTIVSKGEASKFFRHCATEVEMNPPDIPGVIRVGGQYGIEFMPPPGA